MNPKQQIILARALFLFFLSPAIAAAVAAAAAAAAYMPSPPLDRVIGTPPGEVKPGIPVRVPVITWGGDMATILANGNTDVTAKGSLFDQKGLSIELVREDDFKKQVEAYISGDTPWLRGTMGMINMAAEAVSRDPATVPVVVYQLTWSNGGDCLVVKQGINTARDLKGKTICLQAYGPHVDYLAKVLSDAGLSMTDVTIKWVRDLTGTDNTPAQAFHQPDVDAALVIIPDGLQLTSDGTTGTGKAGSVRGAGILLSTRTANRIISDVYAVRTDYFQSHRRDVEKFVHGLMLAEQRLKTLFKNRKKFGPEFEQMITASAGILLDDPRAHADAEALYGDCEFAGFRGNVRFFEDDKWPRNITRLTDEIQQAFMGIGLLDNTAPLTRAQWNYDLFRDGLAGIDDVAAPKFRTGELARVVARKQAMGTLEEGELFSLEINFKPNQKRFSSDLYADGFRKVVDLAATYGGAVITVEGHSDPRKYNTLKKNRGTMLALKRTKQAAKNLSMSRALAVRDSVMEFAGDNGVPLDETQFTVVGHGIAQPKFPVPGTRQQWLSNMRVVFRILQIEAEASVFEPLD